MRSRRNVSRPRAKKLVLAANYRDYLRFCRTRALDPRADAYFCSSSEQGRGTDLSGVLFAPGWEANSRYSDLFIEELRPHGRV